MANTAALSREELEQQERRHDFIRLQRGSQIKAYEDGQKAKQLEVARNLLPMLDDAATVAATGLEVEMVGRLRGMDKQLIASHVLIL